LVVDGGSAIGVVDREPVQGLVVATALEAHVEVDVRKPRVVVGVKPRQLAFEVDRVEVGPAVRFNSHDVFTRTRCEVAGDRDPSEGQELLD
jgi:hypothetical protein